MNVSVPRAYSSIRVLWSFFRLCQKYNVCSIIILVVGKMGDLNKGTLVFSGFLRSTHGTNITLHVAVSKMGEQYEGASGFSRAVQELVV